MLTELRANLPGVEAMLGTAEATGLPDASVDAVVIGSALHWFDRPAADREIARVLRPGGAVGVFGNRRDLDVRWVADLDALLNDRTPAREHPGSHGGERGPFEREWFTEPQTEEFAFTQELDADGLAELFASRSYVIALPEDERAALMEDFRDFARTHPDLAGHDHFELPYETLVTRSFRLPQAMLRS
jgi:SAM-dependent methyltransferase